MQKEILMIKPINGTFIGLFAVMLIIFSILAIALEKKSLETRKKTLVWIMFGTLALFFVYKLLLSMDAEYSAICAAAGEGEFTWWKELPIQLCNINLILVPVSILTGKRELQSFSFFLGPLGAIMALLMPCTGFEYYSLLLPRMWGFYITHWVVFFGSLSLRTFGIYKPKFKDLKRTVITTVILTFAVFLFNMLLRVTGICETANYFFVVEPVGNPILELLHGFIPVPFLYILPCLLILVPYMLLVTWLLNIKKDKNA